MTTDPAAALVDLRVAGSTVALLGGKAAALARAAAAGLDVLPGVVLTTAFCADIDAGADVAGHPAVGDVFASVGDGASPLVARSSSPLEDQVGSSMAGQFESVLGITTLAELEAAVRVVLDSRARAGASGAPIAVLVQPLIEPVLGGVAFGLDPVTGRSDHRVVTAVVGDVAPLVSGETGGARYVLDARGATIERDRADGPAVPRRVLRRLIRLLAAASEVFGGPQDIEWAIDRQDRLWLLQSRPVTSENRGVPTGPIYGPGPIAETFPEPLSELERDLWVPPLRDGVRRAVELARGPIAAATRSTELVVELDGRLAIDLRLAGEAPARGIADRINPIPATRRLRAAWRVGRLRRALPHLAERLLDRVDADLETVPGLDTLSDRQLLALLHRGQAVLTSLHAYEMLIGMLVEPGCGRLTGASVALRVLSEARGDGLDDATILQRSPVVLALTAPVIAPTTVLPRAVVAPDLGQSCEPGSDAGILREALRLRARWMHELTARAAWLIGERLTGTGALPEPGTVRHLSLPALEAIVTHRAVAVPGLIARHQHPPSPSLPARFQLSDRGVAIPVRRGGRASGTGAGGGVGSGPVTFDVIDPPTGSVLVTATLAPSIGPLLPRLAGVICETGSVLSHLAILAREFRVPIVVAYPDASTAFEPGIAVTVDGDAGDVHLAQQGDPS